VSLWIPVPLVRTEVSELTSLIQI